MSNGYFIKNKLSLNTTFKYFIISLMYELNLSTVHIGGMNFIMHWIELCCKCYYIMDT